MADKDFGWTRTAGQPAGHTIHWDAAAEKYVARYATSERHQEASFDTQDEAMGWIDKMYARG